MVASCARTRSEPAVTKAKPPFGSRRGVGRRLSLDRKRARAAARRGSSDRRPLPPPPPASVRPCSISSRSSAARLNRNQRSRGTRPREPEGSEAAATAATCAAGPADGAGRLTEREQQASDFAAETRGLDPAARARRQHPACLAGRFRRQNRSLYRPRQRMSKPPLPLNKRPDGPLIGKQQTFAIAVVADPGPIVADEGAEQLRVPVQTGSGGAPSRAVVGMRARPLPCVIMAARVACHPVQPQRAPPKRAARAKFGYGRFGGFASACKARAIPPLPGTSGGRQGRWGRSSAGGVRPGPGRNML